MSLRAHFSREGLNQLVAFSPPTDDHDAFPTRRNVFVTDLPDRENLERLLRDTSITCAWPIRSEFQTHDAKDCLESLNRAARRPDASILMAAQALGEHPKLHLRHSSERYAVINNFGELARQAPCFADFGGICETAASELLTNAFYNAPRDASGRPSVGDRKIPVALDNPIIIQMGEDDKHLWLTVRDPFGTITREDILRSLLKSSAGESLKVNMGEGGSGIGLYMLFRWAAQLLFILEPGHATTVLFKILKTKRYKTFDAQRAVLEIVWATGNQTGSAI